MLFALWFILLDRGFRIIDSRVSKPLILMKILFDSRFYPLIKLLKQLIIDYLTASCFSVFTLSKASNAPVLIDSV